MLAQNTYLHHLVALFVIYTQVHHHEQVRKTEIEKAIRSLVEEFDQAQVNQVAPAWETSAGVTKFPSIVRQFFQDYRVSQAGVALHKYLLALQNSGRLPATVKNYRSDIGQFLNFAPAKSPDQLVQKSEVARFLEFEQQRGSSQATIHRKVASLSQFFQWLQENGWLTTNLWKSFSSTSFSELLKTDKPVRELTTLSDQTDERPAAWSLPLKNIDIQAYLPQQFQNSLARAVKKTPVLTRLRKAISAQPLLGYFNLAMGIIFFLGAGFLGYRQFFSETSSSLAFPTSLTRPNRSLSFQGRLTSATRSPITSITPMRFKLYDSGPATGSGNLLWDSNSCNIDPDQDGIFSTTLGDACGTEITSDVFTEHSNVWLEVQVNSEILAPRQSIKTVAYALNSETLQGYPASASAVENTVVIMRNDGKVVFGNANPILEATGDSFTLTANTLTLETSSGSNGDVIINPDGTGQTLINSNTIIDGYLYAPGATLSATYAGGTALTLKAGPTATGDIMQWQSSAGSPLGVIDKSGNIGIGTTVARASLEIAGTASSSGTLTFKGTTDPKIDILNGESFGLRTSVGGDVGLTERLTILNNGNIGIGSTTPSQVLDVVGGIRLGAADAENVLNTSTAGGAPSGNLYWGDRTVCDSTGNCSTVDSNWSIAGGSIYPKNTTLDMFIGGIASASAKFAFLNVNSGIPTASIAGNLALAAPTGADPATKLNVYNGGSFGLRTSVGGDAGLAERLTVLNNGNVGIGTTSPVAKLEITDSSSITSLGSEMITNADDRTFASDLSHWSGTNWSIGSGVATHTAGANAYTLSNTYLTSAPEASAVYLVKLTATTTTTGTLTISFGGTTAGVVGYSTGTIYPSYVVVATNTNPLTITPNTAWEGSIDNVSIKKYTTFSSVALQLNQSDGNTAPIQFRTGANNGQSLFIGNNSGQYANTYEVTDSVAIGTSTLRKAQEYGYVAIGANALQNVTDGAFDNAVGMTSLGSLITGYHNNAMGYQSLYALKTGSNNTAIGGSIGSNNFNGIFNTENNSLFGFQAAHNLGSNSTNNVILGMQAGYNIDSGSNNIFLGYQAGYNETGSNKLYIDNSNTSSPLIWGDFASNYINVNGNLGIGSTAPSQKLDVVGGIRLGTADAENVLNTSTAGGAPSGNLYWGDRTVCDSTGNCSVVDSNWTVGSGIIYPKNATLDMFIGGTASASAKFAFLNVNSGIPTASIAGNLALAAPTGADPATKLNVYNGGSFGIQTSVGGDVGLTERLTILNNGNVGIGTTNPVNILDVNGTVNTNSSSFYKIGNNKIIDIENDGTLLVGVGAGLILPSGVDYNTLIGASAGASINNSAADGNTMMGYLSGNQTTTGSINTYIGKSSGYAHQTSYGNVFVGESAGSGFSIMSSANYNTGVGSYSLQNISGGSDYNQTFGAQSGYYLTTTSDNNVFIGNKSGYGVSYYYGNSSNNTFVGSESGYSIGNNQSNNIFIGYQAGYNETGSNKLYIDSSNTSTPLIWGDFASDYVNINGNLGIGSTAPSQKLDVVGGIRLGAADAENVLNTSTAGGAPSGNLYWGDRTVCDSTGNCSTVDSNWTVGSGIIYPKNATLDMFIGGTASSSAKFAFLNVNSGTPTASIAGNLALAAPTGADPATKLNIYNGGSFGIRTSVGGDASLTERLTILNNGNVGIGTTVPSTQLHVGGDATIGGGDLYLTGQASSTSTTEGTIYYDTDDDQLKVYANGKWQADRTTATIIVAANDSSDKEKADYVADGSGGTDDTTTIETAIAALPATGGAVVLLDGTFYLDSTLDITSETNLTFIGLGKATRLLRSFNAARLVDIEDTDDLVFGNMELDGNDATHTSALNYGLYVRTTNGASSASENNYFYNLWIHNNSGAQTINIAGWSASYNVKNSLFENIHVYDNTLNGSTGVYMGTNVGALTLRSLHVKGNAGKGIHLVGGTGSIVTNSEVDSNTDNIYVANTNITVSGNSITGSTESGIYVAGSNNTVSGNTFYNNTNDTVAEAQIMVYTGDNNSVTGNVIEGGSADGIYLGSKYNVVSGNNIQTAGGNSGIYISDDYNLVNGNHIANSAERGILLSGANNNNISNNFIDTPALEGIRLSASNYNQVLNNTIYNPGGSGASDAIALASSSTGNIVVGNTITDTAGSGDAIGIDSGSTTATLSNNTFSGTGATTISDAAASTSYNSQLDSTGQFLINPNSAPVYINASLFVADAGNVGIGSTAPTAKLDIAGTASSSGTLAFRGTTDPKIDILNGENLGIRTSVGGDVGLTERFTILNNGNVGIGSTAPASLLDVAGAGLINSLTLDGNTGTALTVSGTSFGTDLSLQNGETLDNDTDNTVNLGFGAANGILKLTSATEAFLTSSAALNIDSATTNALNIGTGTNAKTITLGNATTTTALALNSGTGDITLTSTDQIKLNSSKAAGGTTTEALSLKSTVDLGVADEVLQIGDSAGDFLTVLGNGNVGIGTTAPASLLDVGNAGSLLGTLRLAGNTSGYVQIQPSAAAGSWTLTLPANDGDSGQVLTTNGSGVATWADAGGSKWTIGLGAIYPNNSTLDFLLGGTATSSAKFAFLNVNSGNPTASISGNLSLVVPTGSSPATKLNVLNGGTLNIQNSVGGDAGLSTSFSVSPTQITSVLPHQFTAAGDVSIAYDLIFTNQTSSEIQTNGPFTIKTGESWENNNLTLSTYGSGNLLANLGDTGKFQITSADPSIILDTKTATDTDFWLGVQEDAGGDDDDIFSIGDGTTIGTNSFFSINTAGNVGIGTTAPAYKLQVTGDIKLTDGTNRLILASNTSNPTGIAGAMFYDSDDAKFKCYTSTWVDCDTTGSGSLPSGTEGQMLYNDAGNWTAFSSLFWDDGNSYFGIGTTIPTAKLDIVGSATTSGTLAFRGTTDPKIDILNGEDLSIRTSVGGDVGLTERLTILNSGNVGIGTTAPTAKLDIAGSASSSGTLAFRGTTDPKIDILNGENFGIRTSVGGDAGLSERFTILNNGNVGIGSTAPANSLDVVGDIGIRSGNDLRLYTTGDSTYNQIYSSTANLYMMGGNGEVVTQAASNIDFQTYTTGTYNSKMILTNAGNLGIGSSSPTQKLTVSGNATVSGTLALGPMVQVDAGTCDASAKGKQYFDGTANLQYVCNGTAWTQMSVAFTSSDGAGVSNSGSGLEFGTNGFGLIQGCADTEVLKWSEGSSIWECKPSTYSKFVSTTNTNIVNSTGNTSSVGTTNVDVDAVIGAASSATQVLLELRITVTNTTAANWSGHVMPTGIAANTTNGVVWAGELDGAAVGYGMAIVALDANKVFSWGLTEIAGTSTGTLEINVVGYWTPVTTGADLAENYYGSSSIEAGDLVSLDPSLAGGVVKSLAENPNSVIGVASSQPGMVLDEVNDPNQAMTIVDNQYLGRVPIAVGLVGRVPVKVTTENGSITAGDPITISSLPGIGMKATQHGIIVGRALENYSNSDPTAVGQVLVFLNLDHFEPLIALDNFGNLVLIQDDNDEYQIVSQATPQASPLVNRFGAFTKAITAMLEAGLIKTKELVVSGRAQIADLSVANLSIDGQTLRDYVVSIIQENQATNPVIAEVSPTPAPTGTASGSAWLAAIFQQDQDTGQPIVENLNVSDTLSVEAIEVASVSAQLLEVSGQTMLGSLLINQNASVAGVFTTNELDANSARIDALEAGMAQFDSVRATTAEFAQATISGTLYAETIADLDKQIAELLGQPALMDVITGNIPSPQDDFTSLYQVLGSISSTASQAGQLNQSVADLNLADDDVVLDASAGFIDRYFKVNGVAYVGDSLGVGNTLRVGQKLELTDNYLSFSAGASNPDESPVFFIQPSGKGLLALMGGLMTLDETGQVTINGDLHVAGDVSVEGSLLANVIEPLNQGDSLKLNLGPSNTGVEATMAGTLASPSGQLEVLGDAGTPVATVSAQGKASFSSLSLGRDLLARPSVAGAATESSQLTQSATQTTGRATLPAGNRDLIIRNPYVRRDSLIYLTPLNSTNNQVLYVNHIEAPADEATAQANDERSFTVSLDNVTASDISFTWWIVN